jgi:cell division control protein 45
VRILGDHRNEEEIPHFDEIFRESDNESDDDDENEDRENDRNESDYDEDNSNDENNDPDNEQNRRSRPISHIEKFERRLKKNREKRDWENKRDKILFNYSQYSYYSRSSALTFFELAWQMSKDSIDLLWYAIIGITEQLLLGKIESSTYTLETQKIQSHVSRLINKLNENSHTATRIAFENDLYLALYRHWSVKESLKNSIYPACKMKLWTLNGKKKLNELFVEMGLPLVQARQQFNSMDLMMKKDFYQMIERTAEKYNMPDIIYGSFTLQYGYKNRFSAADYVYAMMAISEQIENERTAECCYIEALDCLSRNKKNSLESGIDKAKILLNAIFKQVKTSLETQQIYSAGPFLYLILQEENILFSSPYGLTMLSKFMLHGHVAVARSRRVKELPLITCIPIDSTREVCLLIGIPPIGDETKNLFGKAFEQAAMKSNAAIAQDFFDTNIIQIKQSDCPKFIDALTVLLSS